MSGSNDRAGGRESTHEVTPLVVGAANQSEMRRLPPPISRLWLMRYIWSDAGRDPRILSIEHGNVGFVASYGVSHIYPRGGTGG